MMRPETEKTIPEAWEFVTKLISEAHLPYLGLPTCWEGTQATHQLTAWDPVNKEKIDLATGKRTKLATDIVTFIKSTSGANPMPGTAAPAAVRYERFTDPKIQAMAVSGVEKEVLVPCLAHGDYVCVEALQADHIQAKDEIRKRQIWLVEKMNADVDFAKFIMQRDGLNKFFVFYEGKYYGTLYFYELYFNDIDNIWLICQACNLHKSNQDTVAWLKDQWLYGQEFLDYLGTVRDEAITKKSQCGEGLAQVAIEWFWSRHAKYISTAKKLMEEIVVPIQIMGRRIEHVVGRGQHIRAGRLHESLKAKIALIGAVSGAAIGKPKGGAESSHSSSDSEQRMSPIIGPDGLVVEITSEQYQQTVHESVKPITRAIEKIFREKFASVAARGDSRPLPDDEEMVQPDAKSSRDSM